MIKNINGEVLEFIGQTKQHLKDIDSNVCEMRKEIKSLNKRFWIMLMFLTVAVIERLPDLVKIALAAR